MLWIDVTARFKGLIIDKLIKMPNNIDKITIITLPKIIELVIEEMWFSTSSTQVPVPMTKSHCLKYLTYEILGSGCSKSVGFGKL